MNSTDPSGRYKGTLCIHQPSKIKLLANITSDGIKVYPCYSLQRLETLTMYHEMFYVRVDLVYEINLLDLRQLLNAVLL
jgi:hypothetical protein